MNDTIEIGLILNKIIYIIAAFFTAFSNLYASDLDTLSRICREKGRREIEDSFVKYFYVRLAVWNARDVLTGPVGPIKFSEFDPGQFELVSPDRLQEVFLEHCPELPLSSAEWDRLIQRSKRYLVDQIIAKHAQVIEHAKAHEKGGIVLSALSKDGPQVTFVATKHDDPNALLWEAGFVLDKVKKNPKTSVFREIFSGPRPYYWDYLSFNILLAISVESRTSLGWEWDQPSLAAPLFLGRVFTLIKNDQLPEISLGAIKELSYLSVVNLKYVIPTFGWEPSEKLPGPADMNARNQRISELIKLNKSDMIIELGSAHCPPLGISIYQALLKAFRLGKESVRPDELARLFKDVVRNIDPYADELYQSRRVGLKFSPTFSPEESAEFFLKEAVDLWRSTKSIYQALESKSWQIGIFNHAFYDQMKSFLDYGLKERDEALEGYILTNRCKKAAIGGTCFLVLGGICYYCL